MLPGRSSLKIRLKFWVAMFASHGVVALAPDLGSHGIAARDGQKFLAKTKDYPVDPTNIHLIGYSAGAQAVLKNALNRGKKKIFKSFTVVAGLIANKPQKHLADPNPILFIQAQNDGF